MVHELKPRACYKLCLAATTDGFADLCRARDALGDSFYVRTDNQLTGFVVGLLEEDRAKLPPDLNSRVIPMRDEGVMRDVSPFVWRFLEEKYIEDFFNKGQLQLSTFCRCKGDDSARRDTNEGFVEWYSTDNKKIASCSVGSNAFMLCFSLSPFAANPKGCEHALFVLNLDGLIGEVTKGIRKSGYDVSAVVKGPCTYSSRQCMVADTFPRTDEALQKLNDAPGDRLYMMKDARLQYMHEWEYRVLWLTDSKKVPDHLMISIESPNDYAQSIIVPPKALMYSK